MIMQMFFNYYFDVLLHITKRKHAKEFTKVFVLLQTYF